MSVSKFCTAHVQKSLVLHLDRHSEIDKDSGRIDHLVVYPISQLATLPFKVELSSPNINNTLVTPLRDSFKESYYYQKHKFN